MSLKVDALFQHLMKDPDIIPDEGEEKEDIAMALAEQRAKQANNNEKALNMAIEKSIYSSIDELSFFTKASKIGGPRQKVKNEHGVERNALKPVEDFNVDDFANDMNTLYSWNEKSPDQVRDGSQDVLDKYANHLDLIQSAFGIKMDNVKSANDAFHLPENQGTSAKAKKAIKEASEDMVNHFEAHATVADTAEERTQSINDAYTRHQAKAPSEPQAARSLVTSVDAPTGTSDAKDFDLSDAAVAKVTRSKALPKTLKEAYKYLATGKSEQGKSRAREALNNWVKANPDQKTIQQVTPTPDAPEEAPEVDTPEKVDVDEFGTPVNEIGEIEPEQLRSHADFAPLTGRGAVSPANHQKIRDLVGDTPQEGDKEVEGVNYSELQRDIGTYRGILRQAIGDNTYRHDALVAGQAMRGKWSERRKVGDKIGGLIDLEKLPNTRQSGSMDEYLTQLTGTSKPENVDAHIQSIEQGKYSHLSTSEQARRKVQDYIASANKGAYKPFDTDEIKADLDKIRNYSAQQTDEKIVDKRGRPVLDKDKKEQFHTIPAIDDFYKNAVNFLENWTKDKDGKPSAERQSRLQEMGINTNHLQQILAYVDNKRGSAASRQMAAEREAERKENAQKETPQEANRRRTAEAQKKEGLGVSARTAQAREDKEQVGKGGLPPTATEQFSDSVMNDMADSFVNGVHSRETQQREGGLPTNDHIDQAVTDRTKRAQEALESQAAAATGRQPKTERTPLGSKDPGYQPDAVQRTGVARLGSQIERGVGIGEGADWAVDPHGNLSEVKLTPEQQAKFATMAGQIQEWRNTMFSHAGGVEQDGYDSYWANQHPEGSQEEYDKAVDGLMGMQHEDAARHYQKRSEADTKAKNRVNEENKPPTRSRTRRNITSGTQDPETREITYEGENDNQELAWDPEYWGSANDNSEQRVEDEETDIDVPWKKYDMQQAVTKLRGAFLGAIKGTMKDGKHTVGNPTQMHRGIRALRDFSEKNAEHADALKEHLGIDLEQIDNLVNTWDDPARPYSSGPRRNADSTTANQWRADNIIPQYEAIMDGMPSRSNIRGRVVDPDEMYNHTMEELGISTIAPTWEDGASRDEIDGYHQKINNYRASIATALREKVPLRDEVEGVAREEFEDLFANIGDGSTGKNALDYSDLATDGDVLSDQDQALVNRFRNGDRFIGDDQQLLSRLEARHNTHSWNRHRTMREQSIARQQFERQTRQMGVSSEEAQKLLNEDDAKDREKLVASLETSKQVKTGRQNRMNTGMNAAQDLINQNKTDFTWQSLIDSNVFSLDDVVGMGYFAEATVTNGQLQAISSMLNELSEDDAMTKARLNQDFSGHAKGDKFHKADGDWAKDVGGAKGAAKVHGSTYDMVHDNIKEQARAVLEERDVTPADILNKAYEWYSKDNDPDLLRLGNKPDGSWKMKPLRDMVNNYLRSEEFKNSLQDLPQTETDFKVEDLERAQAVLRGEAGDQPIEIKGVKYSPITIPATLKETTPDTRRHLFSDRLMEEFDKLKAEHQRDFAEGALALESADVDKIQAEQSLNSYIKDKAEGSHNFNLKLHAFLKDMEHRGQEVTNGRSVINPGPKPFKSLADREITDTQRMALLDAARLESLETQAEEATLDDKEQDELEELRNRGIENDLPKVAKTLQGQMAKEIAFILEDEEFTPEEKQGAIEGLHRGGRSAAKNANKMKVQTNPTVGDIVFPEDWGDTPENNNKINDLILEDTSGAVIDGNATNEDLDKAVEHHTDNDPTSSNRNKILNANGQENAVEKRMSRQARNHLSTNGIDPDGEDVAHIKNIKEAREHINSVSSRNHTPSPADPTEQLIEETNKDSQDELDSNASGTKLTDDEEINHRAIVEKAFKDGRPSPDQMSHEEITSFEALRAHYEHHGEEGQWEDTLKQFAGQTTDDFTDRSSSDFDSLSEAEKNAILSDKDLDTTDDLYEGMSEDIDTVKQVMSHGDHEDRDSWHEEEKNAYDRLENNLGDNFQDKLNEWGQEAQKTPEASGLDAFQENHLQEWLDRTVGEKDSYHEDERNGVEAGIRRMLEEDSSMLDENKSWPEIRQRAEREGHMWPDKYDGYTADVNQLGPELAHNVSREEWEPESEEAYKRLQEAHDAASGSEEEFDSLLDIWSESSRRDYEKLGGDTTEKTPAPESTTGELTPEEQARAEAGTGEFASEEPVNGDTAVPSSAEARRRHRQALADAGTAEFTSEEPQDIPGGQPSTAAERREQRATERQEKRKTELQADRGAEQGQLFDRGPEVPPEVPTDAETTEGDEKPVGSYTGRWAGRGRQSRFPTGLGADPERARPDERIQSQRGGRTLGEMSQEELEAEYNRLPSEEKEQLSFEDYRQELLESGERDRSEDPDVPSTAEEERRQVPEREERRRTRGKREGYQFPLPEGRRSKKEIEAEPWRSSGREIDEGEELTEEEQREREINQGKGMESLLDQGDKIARSDNSIAAKRQEVDRKRSHLVNELGADPDYIGRMSDEQIHAIHAQHEKTFNDKNMVENNEKNRKKANDSLSAEDFKRENGYTTENGHSVDHITTTAGMTEYHKSILAKQKTADEDQKKQDEIHNYLRENGHDPDDPDVPTSSMDSAKNHVKTSKDNNAKEDVLKSIANVRGKIHHSNPLHPDHSAHKEFLDDLRAQHTHTSLKDLQKRHTDLEKNQNTIDHDYKVDLMKDKVERMEPLGKDADKHEHMHRLREILKTFQENELNKLEHGEPLLSGTMAGKLKHLLTHDQGAHLETEDFAQVDSERRSMGDSFMNEDHRNALAEQRNSDRAHEADHRELTTGLGGHSERQSAFNHSKAHELHHYEQDEDGNLQRTGVTFKGRDSKGNVISGGSESGGKRSEEEAAQHATGGTRDTGKPPKILGLDAEGKKKQDRHRDLMKRALTTAGITGSDLDEVKQLESDLPQLADPSYKANLLGAMRHMVTSEAGHDILEKMGIESHEDREAAMESSCKPPMGNIEVGKAWNPATHRWCDKEYLEELQKGINPGEGMYMKDGLHHGTDNEHLDKDADGNAQPVLVTPTGVHKVNQPTGDINNHENLGHRSAQDVAGDTLGAHLGDHEHGDKVGRDTLDATGINQGIHGSGGRRQRKIDPDTPLQKRSNAIDKSNEGKDNGTALERQMNRRGNADASPLTKLLERSRGRKESGGTLSPKQYVGESLRDVGSALPGVLGSAIRGTDAWKQDQYKNYKNAEAKKQSEADKFSQRIAEWEKE